MTCCHHDAGAEGFALDMQPLVASAACLLVTVLTCLCLAACLHHLRHPYGQELAALQQPPEAAKHSKKHKKKRSKVKTSRKRRHSSSVSDSGIVSSESESEEQRRRRHKVRLCTHAASGPGPALLQKAMLGCTCCLQAAQGAVVQACSACTNKLLAACPQPPHHCRHA